MTEIKKVGVVGCGTMGAGIVEVAARAGLDVLVAVSRPASEAAGRARLTASLDKAVRKEKISEAERDAALSAVAFTTDLADLADRQLVVEATTEDEDAKLSVLRRIDAAVEAPDVILASTTSSIPISRLAKASTRPERVIGVHFFNPVPAMPLVELIGSLLTDPDVYARTETFVADTLRKQPVRSGDRAGFIVNALLIPYLLAGIRMVESGFSCAEDVDKAMTLGCAHPMGPLALADLIGLDTVSAIADAMYDEFHEPHYSPPHLLLRMVDAGLLGRKTGRGFHIYQP
ncbi:3-hydroxybutyryl-CoA dehydrogenase [Saccharothrix sp. NRRL B-16348]|uniref:3-hydroxybutyryl-CoA dehydrogenase n=1 Tax=Saccharothrix sp. NRRL B-16348 TaxID=1415542 RepID=UPI0006AFCE12|nr:3-hydroxybutyryl-CoA dehydrogenase [Saccharothrix sp. NRRL B-16348]KOX21834.1 3-hydroxybutyryl-CoA dehydrogenase [Saccharothrix sp. NRRL B-16348]